MRSNDAFSGSSAVTLSRIIVGEVRQIGHARLRLLISPHMPPYDDPYQGEDSGTANADDDANDDLLAIVAQASRPRGTLKARNEGGNEGCRRLGGGHGRWNAIDRCDKVCCDGGDGFGEGCRVEG